MPTKILAVDDSATMRKILEMTFAAEDVEIVTLADGAAAIQKAAESSPDIILADVSMQGADAYAVAHAVKNNPALAKTAVIAMASSHHPFDEQKGQSAGIDAHVQKPFETQALIDLIEKVLRAPRAVADESAPASAAPPMPTSSTQTTAAHIPPPPSSARKPPARPTTSFGEAPKIPPAPGAQPKPVLELADEPDIEIDAPEPPPKRPITRPLDTTSSATQRDMPPPAARPVAPPRAPSSPAIPAAKPAPAQRPAAPAAPATPAALAPAKPAAPPAAARAPQATQSASTVEAATSGLEAKLQGLGLSGDQLNAILALSREVIEEVVWEVVPELAETLIKEEIARLTR